MLNNEMIRYIVLFVCCIYFSKEDIKTKCINNKAMLLSACIGFLLLLFSMDKFVYISNISAGILGFLISFFAAWLSKWEIGMGDVKLIGTAGFYIGMISLQIAIFWALVLILLLGLIQWITKKITIKKEYPFVPFFTVGVFIAFCMRLFN